MNSPYFRLIKPAKNPRANLICFPFAGSGASIYQGWRNQIDGRINLYGLQAPGREDRIKEEPLINLNKLIDELMVSLSSLNQNLPIILFGHSLGAIIAYELAKKIHGTKIKSALLIVSGRQAPNILSKFPSVSHLNDEQLLQEITVLNGIPDEILQNNELLEIVLPVLRADFKLADNYYAEIKDKLDCPVIAICSLDDPWVSVEEANKWKLTTIGLFQVKTFLGDHFYFKKNPSDLINFINLQIAAII